jgi:hypothetical protein
VSKTLSKTGETDWFLLCRFWCHGYSLSLLPPFGLACLDSLSCFVLRQDKTRDKRRQETRDKRQETRDKRRQETRDKRQETRNKKQETRNKKQETRNHVPNVLEDAFMCKRTKARAARA